MRCECPDPDNTAWTAGGEHSGRALLLECADAVDQRPRRIDDVVENDAHRGRATSPMTCRTSA